MVNRAGVSYDAARTKDIYAEDFNKDRDEIVAIETELGADPKGAYADVAARLQYLEDNLGGIAFPIGSVYIAIIDTDPATLLGYGTWSRIAEGQCLVGLKSTDTDFDKVEKTGGTKTHTLSLTEIPAHNHEAYGLKPPGGDNSRIDVGSGAGNRTPCYTANTGGGGAHNNLQPYFVVYIWKRIS